MNTSTPSTPSSAIHRPFVFLDRDGTVILDRHHLSRPDGVELCPGAASGLRALQNAGRRLVIVSNQSGIGRGYFRHSDLQAVNDRLRQVLAVQGIGLEAIYCCPHAPEDGCVCRKPRPGLVLQALTELGGDLQGAWVIGDSASDMQLARNLGLAAVYVTTGRAPLAREALHPEPDYWVKSLADAADLIVSRLPRTPGPQRR